MKSTNSCKLILLLKPHLSTINIKLQVIFCLFCRDDGVSGSLMAKLMWRVFHCLLPSSLPHAVRRCYAWHSQGDKTIQDRCCLMSAALSVKAVKCLTWCGVSPWKKILKYSVCFVSADASRNDYFLWLLGEQRGKGHWWWPQWTDRVHHPVQPKRPGRLSICVLTCPTSPGEAQERAHNL